MSRVSALARRLRPSSRRGLVAAIAGAIVLVGVLAVGVAVGGAVFSSVYAEYGFHPEQNARDWAALTPVYAESSVCQRCHAVEQSEWQAKKHATVACESCHGPLAAHVAAAGSGAADAVTAVAAPPTGLCTACHEQSPARPAAFPQVDLASHFADGPCLGCHNPHSLTTLHPPAIPHSLDRLPACVTCHKPEGLKPVPAGHVRSTDAVCRTCHKLPDGT